MVLGVKCRAKRLAALCCTLVFASCASMKQNIKYPVHVTNTAVIDLLPASDMKGAIDGLFSLEMKSKGKSFCALSYLTADDTGIYATLLNDFGMNIASLSYTGEELNLDSAVLPKNMRAQYLVADLQFALYDIDALQSALNGAGLVLKIDGDSTRRTIMKGKKIIEEIEINGGNIKVSNVLRDYELYATKADK